jgi:ParB family chromosome partitioning protein
LSTNKPARKKPRRKKSQSKSNSLEQIKNRTTKAAKSLSKVDRVREDKEKVELLKPVVVDLKDIQLRPGGDTRVLNLSHVIQLVESIAALGLLEPLVVDQEVRLLAGAHRLAALQILSESPGNRLERLEEICGVLKGKSRSKIAEILTEIRVISDDESLSDVPVRVLAFDATKDADRALAVEAAENSLRRDYTPQEVFGLYHRLLDAGYTIRPGKPKKGEKPLKPALAVVIGKSVKTVERLLKKNEQEASGEPEHHNIELLKALTMLESAITRIVSHKSSQEEDPSATDELAEDLSRTKLHRLIRRARAEAL